MILSRLLPEAGERIDLAQPEAIDRLAELYRPGRSGWLRINSVLSLTGSVTGSDGTSDSLTNRVDRTLLGVIRRLADVTLVGAGSVRAEGHLLPKQGILAVVTARGDLTGHRFDAAVTAHRLIVLCTPAAVRTVERTLGDVKREIVTIDPVDGRMPPARIIAALRERGLHGIVCEGGPDLAAQLITADLVDELCLTTSPTLTVSAAPFLGGPGADRRLQLTQLLVDDSSALYARWSIRDQGCGSACLRSSDRLEP